jgi:hypothetical protein
VVGSAQPDAIAEFRKITGYDGVLLVDPSLRTFEAAGLAHGMRETFDPRSILRGVRAFASGFRPGARRGAAFQQGGTFVVGPGDTVHFVWRDRFAGDHPALADVVAALPPR